MRGEPSPTVEERRAAAIPSLRSTRGLATVRCRSWRVCQVQGMVVQTDKEYGAGVGGKGEEEREEQEGG